MWLPSGSNPKRLSERSSRWPRWTREQIGQRRVSLRAIGRTRRARPASRSPNGALFVEIDGAEKAEWANTINRDLGETIDALDQGEMVLVQTKATDFGLDVVAIRTSDVPSKHQEAAPATELAEDDIPF
jgi:hypothetical protein